MGFLSDLWLGSLNLSCPIGYYVHERRCASCPRGTFGSREGVCNVCPLGSYTDEPGLLACTECTVGFYQPDTGKASCLPCPSFALCTRTNFKCEEGYYRMFSVPSKRRLQLHNFHLPSKFQTKFRKESMCQPGIPDNVNLVDGPST